MSNGRGLVVLGLGNMLLRDEGIGVHAIRALEADKPPGVVLVDGGTGGRDLLYWIEDAAGLIVIDGIDCGAEPGALFRFRPEDLALKVVDAPYSLHDERLPEILHAAAQAGRLPPTVILAVQVGEVDWGLELSPPVETALARVVAAIRREIAFWAANGKFAPPPGREEKETRMGEEP